MSKDSKKLAECYVFAWLNVASDWDGTAHHLMAAYGDKEGAEDARKVAAAIRTAAERLHERAK